MKLAHNILHGYAKEQGFYISRGVYIRKDFSFELRINLRSIDVFFNGGECHMYRLSTITDCIDFCNLLSSISYLKKINIS
ncbi:hypothetical protein ACFLJZ_000182 [Vibrio alginolyticus]